MSLQTAGLAQPGGMRKGIAYALAAYGCWGVVPLYWRELERLEALEILAHRVLWSLLFVGLLLLITRRFSQVIAALGSRKKMSYLVISGALIAANWGLFIWAVLHHRLLEASLGYFMNPLVTVVLGVALLGERLRTAQTFAVLLGALGLVVMWIATSAPVWLAFSLASSFAVYGYLRKVAPVESLTGLFVETLLIAPAALWLLVGRELAGVGLLSRADWALLPLAVLAGPVTALPLAFFGAALRLLPLSALGFFQYIAPSLQFLIAIFAFGEAVDSARLAAFSLIWLALLIVSFDAFRQHSVASDGADKLRR